ncbi:MAG: hypothetical protein ABEL51_14355, partial [Salinibacter sp.]
SGFEVLELLDARSALAQFEDRLSDEERRRVEAADRAFLAHARRFYESVRRVANLEGQRQRAKASPSHWWWYLDELVELSEREPSAPQQSA